MARVSSEERKTQAKLLLENEDMATELDASESTSQQRITLQTLSPEVLGLILQCLSAKTLLNVSETCRSLHSECLGNGALWKELCKVDFQIPLLVKGQFDSFHDIYRLLFKSQIIFEERNHVTFSGMLPDWMFTWCIMSNTPPSLKFFLLPIGKAKRLWGLLDEELPRGELSGSRRSIAWSEGFDAAVCKWGSEAAFQEQVLRRLTRSQKKVESLYMQELQSRRKRYYKRLRMGEKYAKLNDVLVKNKNTHIYLSYFEPQLIGEHYINGKLHRFGRKQLKEYMKFAIKLYDNAKASGEDCRESDLVECVLLTYKDMAVRVENHFVRWKEFLEYSQKFLTRQQKVWRWQTEKSIDHCLEYRPSEKVQAMQAYKDYIHTGDVRRFRLLRRHFEGHERICQWIDLNSWILDIIDISAREALLDRDETDALLPGLTNEARELRRSINVFLQSGKDYDFRMVLWTISTIAKSRLKQSASLIKELECMIKTDRSNVLVSVETELLSKDLRRYRPLPSVSSEHHFIKTRPIKTVSKPVFMRCRARKTKRTFGAEEETPPNPNSNVARLEFVDNSHESSPEAAKNSNRAIEYSPGTSNRAALPSAGSSNSASLVCAGSSNQVIPIFARSPNRTVPPCAGRSSQAGLTCAASSNQAVLPRAASSNQAVSPCIESSNQAISPRAASSNQAVSPCVESSNLHFLRKRPRLSTGERRTYQQTKQPHSCSSSSSST